MSWKRTPICTVSLTTCLCAAACAVGDPTDQPIGDPSGDPDVLRPDEVVQSQAQRITAPQVMETDAQALAADNERFALELYQLVKDREAGNQLQRFRNVTRLGCGG